MQGLTPVVKNLLILNVLIFGIQAFSGIDINYWGGLRHMDSEMFYPWQFITYMFMHGSWWHLFGNMFGLFIFGPNLERVWGSQRFLLFWMVTGVGAAACYFGVRYYEMTELKAVVDSFINNPDPIAFSEFLREFSPRLHTNNFDFLEAFQKDPTNSHYIAESSTLLNDLYTQILNVPMVGASGSLFGVLMGFGMLFPNTTLVLMFPPIPVKAKYLVAFYAIYEVVTGLQKSPGDNVAHYAHLGGMLFAFILIKVWQKKTNNFY